MNLRLKRAAALHRRRQIRRSWDLSPEEFWTFQRDRFQTVYAAARENVPYYRSELEMYPELAWADKRVDATLASLPVVPKSIVKTRMTDFYPDVLPRLTSFHTTSGTTGTPLRIPATIWERGFSQACYEEWLRRIAGSTHPPAVFLSGFMTPSADDPHLYWQDALSRSAYLSIYALHVKNRPAIQELFAELRPRLVFGYGSALHELAALMDHVPLPGQADRVAISTSEVFPDDWRVQIEATLCRKAYDFYASQEGQHMVIECELGGRHINPLIGIVEILDEDGAPTPAGEVGRVVVTGLEHDTMPLIRYEIGDRAVSTGYATDCACGLGWPTIGAVEGRSEDLVLTRDGRRVGYLCFHATKNLTGIREAQLVQTSLDEFVFNIVPSESEPFDRVHVEASITAELERRLEQDITLEFRYPEAIARGPNGKFKAVRVDLAPASAAAPR